MLDAIIPACGYWRLSKNLQPRTQRMNLQLLFSLNQIPQRSKSKPFLDRASYPEGGGNTHSR